jgi:hypothetical protein
MNLRRPAPVSHTVSMTAIDGRFGTKTQSATSSSAHIEAVHVLQRRRLQSFGFASSPRIAHWNGIPPLMTNGAAHAGRRWACPPGRVDEQPRQWTGATDCPERPMACSSASNRPPPKVVHLDRGLLFNLTAKTEPTDLPLTIGVRIVAPNGLQHQEARTSPTASSEFTVCPSTLPEYRHRVPYRVFTG